MRSIVLLRRQPVPTRQRFVLLLAHFCCGCLLIASSFYLVSTLVSMPASASENTPAAHNGQTNSAQASSESTSREQAGTNIQGRHTLKGSTLVIEYKLSDLASYREGIAALEKRNFSLGEGLFKAAAAQLDEGYEKYRAECFFFEGKCLVGMGKTSDAVNVFKAAVKLFDQHDPKNPYKAVAVKQIAELSSGKGRMDTATLQSGTAMQSARISVDQHITFATGVTKNDTSPFLLRVNKESVSRTVYNCFADMTCLETAEIGSNINNAVGRWQPLLVHDAPAAFNLGSSNPAVNVKLSGVNYKINLPTFRGLKRILLATDGEKICAMDLDSYDSWLLRMKKNKGGSIQSVSWDKLTHVKDHSDSSVGLREHKPIRSSGSENKASSSYGLGSKSSNSSGWDGFGASGWNSKASSNRRRTSGSSWWDGKTGGSSWSNVKSGSSGWGASSPTSGSSSFEQPRHFSRDGRRGGSRGSSGF